MRLFIILIILPILSFAQDPDSLCELGADVANTRGKLDFVPEYFFKPMPPQGPQDNREEVSIISRDGNVFYDMKTGNYRRVPGSIDGTATPDGQFMVTPMTGLTFYDRDTVNGSSAPAFEDTANTLEGVYQSVGLLPGSNDKKVYRAITDTLTTGNTRGNSLMYKDFSTKPGPNGPVFDANNHPAKPLCSNLGSSPFKLPMISKDGKMLAAFDVNSGTTKIFNVKQTNGVSNCELKKDLGFATGKVEFSNDGNKIVFAADSHPTISNDVTWYEQPTQDQNFNVYVVDMKEDSIQRISKLKKGSAYYPSFWKDDSVVYMEQTPNSENRRDNNYTVVRTKLESAEKMKFVSFDKVNSCSGIPSDTAASLALGAMWYDICSDMNESVSTQGLAYLPLAMDPLNCKKMVNKYWDQFKADVKNKKTKTNVTADSNKANEDVLNNYYQQFVGASKSSLLAACPKGKKSEEVKVVEANQSGNNDIEGENKLFLCQQCHTSQHKYPIDFSDPSKLADRKDQIFGVVFTRHMPKGSNMSEQERMKLLDWIEKNVPSEK
ncbi:MAG: hypothetical protein K2P81_13335 [Bacteriovoracaceae bacterium]|nr:hypothetical protein [Bacteriovoracaceae bacterium]